MKSIHNEKTKWWALYNERIKWWGNTTFYQTTQCHLIFIDPFVSYRLSIDLEQRISIKGIWETCG